VAAGTRIAVLASGNGGNFQAILDNVHGREGITVVGLVTNKTGIRAIERAEQAGVPVAIFKRDDYPDRAARDEAICDWLDESEVDLVVLAGYMELISANFVSRYNQRIINVHPALLPSFPGLNGIGQALDHGVKVTGVTVHFVDDGMDTGPIILQEAVAIPEDATVDTLAEKIHEVEHRLLPEAIFLAAAGRLSIDPDNPRRVLIAAEN